MKRITFNKERAYSILILTIGFGGKERHDNFLLHKICMLFRFRPYYGLLYITPIAMNVVGLSIMADLIVSLFSQNQMTVRLIILMFYSIAYTGMFFRRLVYVLNHNKISDWVGYFKP